MLGEFLNGDVANMGVNTLPISKQCEQLQHGRAVMYKNGRYWKGDGLIYNK